MRALLFPPHSLIRRNLSRIERGLVAAGLTGLLYSLVKAVPVFPEFWDIVALSAVLVVTYYAPALGYAVAVFAAAFPISAISIYLGVLFLCVTLLLHQVLIRNLGGAVLVAAAPLLAGYDLAWAIPLLGGLWWGPAGGGWIGGLAALWGMTAAGMAKLPPDWLQMMGSLPAISAVTEQFGPANSLDTLLMLLDPIAPDSTTLLYHLLQIALWGLVGILVGKAADRGDLLKRRPWGAVLGALTGAVCLLGGHILFGIWLNQHTADSLFVLWPNLLAATAVAAILTALLETLRDFFEHPLPIFKFPRRKQTQPVSTPTPGQSTSPSAAAPNAGARWQQPPQPTKDDEEDDLIMLELD